MENKVEDALRSIYNYPYAYYSGINSERFFQSLTKSFNTSDLYYEGQPDFPISRPDILVFDDEFVYGIEHFEFDDSKRTRKGSASRTFMSKKERDFQENFKKNSIPSKPYSESFDMTEESSFDNGYEYFVDNFLYSFDEHYKKINEYKINIENLLKEKNMKRKIKIYFLVENASLMMPYCSCMPDHEDDGATYVPFNSKEILERINAAVDLDGIISLNKKNKPLIIVCSRDDGILDTDIIVDKNHYCSASKPVVMTSQFMLEIKKNPNDTTG